MRAEPIMEAATIERGMAGTGRRQRSRRKPFDGRTRAGYRARRLQAHYTAVLTAAGREITVELAALVSKAAELSSIAEGMRARMLRGEDISADDIVRVQRLADLSVRRLGLPSTPVKLAGPSLGAALRRLEAGS
jgi:hypothetical protein